jgi:predicted kinase
MKTLVFVVGLPGSGKTTWAKNQNDGFVVDDPKFIEEVKVAIDNNDKVV